MALHALESLGLTKTESDLYELLLKRGETPVADLIQASGLKRPTVYKALYTLEKKGLVSQKDIKKKLNFRPESPTLLLEQAETRFQEAAQTKNTLESVIPQLLSDYTMSVEKPTVTIYEGVEGIKKVYLDTLEEGKEIYAALQTSEVEPEIYDWLNSYYGPQRTKHKIHAKVIVASGKWSAEYRKDDIKNFRTTTMIPNEKFPFQNEMNIYGDKVAFMAYKKDASLIGIIIKNPLITKTMKALFDLAWVGAEKYH